MKYLGIDLHSNRFTCCFLSENNGKKIITYNLDSQGIKDFLTLVNQGTSIMVGASTNTFSPSILCIWQSLISLNITPNLTRSINNLSNGETGSIRWFCC